MLLLLLLAVVLRPVARRVIPLVLLEHRGSDDRDCLRDRSLARDETLMNIARARVADMVARGYTGHNDPVTGEGLGRSMILNAGYRLAGENWYGTRNGPPATGETAMNWFMTDDLHARAVLSPNYTVVGVGIAFNGTQWLLIQNFAAP